MKRKLLFCVALFTLSSSYSMEEVSEKEQAKETNKWEVPENCAKWTWVIMRELLLYGLPMAAIAIGDDPTTVIRYKQVGEFMLIHKIMYDGQRIGRLVIDNYCFSADDQKEE